MPDAIVIQPVAYLFDQPGQGIYSQAVYGLRLPLIGDSSGDWQAVQFESGDVWIAGEAIITSDRLPSDRLWLTGADAAHTDTTTRDGWRVVTGLEAHVFATPSMKAAPPVLRLPYCVWLPLAPDVPGGEVASADDPDGRDKFTAVALVDGTTGYIRAGDLSAALPALDHHDLPALALRFLGRPYTWGGNSSVGFDCSGLALLCARHRGHRLPHQTRAQYSRDELPLTTVAVRPSPQADIPTDELQAGDLIYFTLNGEPSGIYHVAVYAGNARFLHASASGVPSVQWGSLTDERPRARYIGARRIA